MYSSAGKQRGVTLIEVLVGVTVGLIILAGAVTVMTRLSFSGLENSRAARLNQELRSTLDFIHRDLQRAGYVKIWDEVNWASWDDVDQAASDAMELALGVAGVVNLGGATTDVDADGYNEFSCITFAYDRNDSGIADPDEIFGFRFNGGAVELGTSGATAATCAGGGSWQDITSSGITVTRLSFERQEYDAVADTGDSQIYEIAEAGADEPPCGAGDTCLDRRAIHVVLEGRLATDAAVTVALRDQVKIKNDHYYRFDDLP